MKRPLCLTVIELFQDGVRLGHSISQYYKLCCDTLEENVVGGTGTIGITVIDRECLLCQTMVKCVPYFVHVDY